MHIKGSRCLLPGLDFSWTKVQIIMFILVARAHIFKKNPIRYSVGLAPFYVFKLEISLPRGGNTCESFLTLQTGAGAQFVDKEQIEIYDFSNKINCASWGIRSIL